MVNLLFVLLLFIPVFFLSAETHSITPTVNYNVEQKSAPGYGLSYQYNFNPSIQLDLGFQDSNTLEIQLNEGQLIGKY